MADCTVQHVSKAASDKLLSKFAETVSGPEELGKCVGVVRKRRKEVVREIFGCRTGGQWMVEKRSLLPVSNRRKGRRLEVIRMKEIIISSMLLGKVEKTWRGTLGRASKMFMERHSNRHVRLINDAD